jgi:hypothetical protein
MSTTRDWLPTSREQQLEMADDWISVCTVKQTDWNIPGPAITELTTLRDTARAALETAKNETTRTPVATAQCKEAFDALTAFMRDFKRRYFLSPPLLDSDYISLGLKPHDPTPTPSGVPCRASNRRNLPYRTARTRGKDHLCSRHRHRSRQQRLPNLVQRSCAG